MTNTRNSFLNKFIKKEHGCWEWQKGFNSKGYGMFYYKNKDILAHRFAYEFFIGKIENMLFVCHKCDNPKCVNPNHLFLGTQKDNVKDMIIKGRKFVMPRDENTETKIFTDDIKLIKEMYGVEKVKTIAEKFNVSRQTIYRVVRTNQGVTI